MGNVKEELQGMDEQLIADASAKILASFGAANEMFASGYGQIIEDGKPTIAGLAWYEDNKNELDKLHANVKAHEERAEQHQKQD